MAKIDTGWVNWDGGVMGYLLPEDWDLMEQYIDQYHIKRVVEFGSGISTRLFLLKGVLGMAYEQSSRFADKIRSEFPAIGNRIAVWDGKKVIAKQADMCFIDGPWCDGTDSNFPDRSCSYKMARVLCPTLIAVHDFDRKEEQANAKRYLDPAYDLIASSRITAIFRIKTYHGNN